MGIYVFFINKCSLAVKPKQVRTNTKTQSKILDVEATSALTVRRIKAKFTCRDTHNIINWLASYAQWLGGLSKEEAAKPRPLHRSALEKEDTQKNIFVEIIVAITTCIAFNHRQGKIKYPLILMYNQEYGKVGVIHRVALTVRILDASSFCKHLHHTLPRETESFHLALYLKTVRKTSERNVQQGEIFDSYTHILDLDKN